MKNENTKIEIRECSTLEEFRDCAKLQKEVFGLPDIEVSPVRHLIVTKSAGGFVLGAFDGENLIGFVLSVPGFDAGERFFYSHMTAVSQKYQNGGIGAKLKWTQRDFSLARNVNFIKWTFQPVLARNANFNLNRLGATIKKYLPNFYGTDYPNLSAQTAKIGLDSDRLYCNWDLNSEKVIALSNSENFAETGEIALKIEIPNDWNLLVKSDLKKAQAEQERIKNEFQTAFAENLICRAFERSETNPKYVLFKND
ncbi:MAG: GNAT family N-acetyltransferase [Pyrinomonadaceae bacterium]